VDGHASARSLGQTKPQGGEVRIVVKCLRVSGLLRRQAKYSLMG